ncbi:MAG TPA: alpha/beta hydrolase [Polyangia bacterium]|nr:alpha/beta hydrolase [Polyangia bacterium]
MADRRGHGYRDLLYPMAVSTLAVDDLEIAYSDGGQGGRTLLLLHGLASYMPVWSRMLGALRERHRVVALDLPGHGRSSKPDCAYAMSWQARVVDRVMGALELAQVTLCGHSMGGQIALLQALAQPRRVDALVLVAPAGFETFSEREEKWLRAAWSEEVIRSAPPELVQARVEAAFFEMPPEAGFVLRDRLAIIGGPDFDGFARAVARSVGAMLAEPVLDRLHEITQPTLVVFGADDAMIPNPILHTGTAREVAEQGMARLRDAELLMLPRTGHMVQLEQPAALAGAMLDFLARRP